MRAESVFGQLFLFSIEHDVDLELTLSLPLEPVLRQLSISDGMPTKTDKSKLLLLKGGGSVVVDFLFIVTPFVGVCNCSMFCCTLLYVHSSIAIILMGKRELIALLNLSSWCLVMVERLFLAVPRGCLQFVIVVFPDHTHLLFLHFLESHIEPTIERPSNTAHVLDDNAIP